MWKWIVSHISHTKCSALLIVTRNLDLSPRASLSEEALTSPNRKKIAFEFSWRHIRRIQVRLHLWRSMIFRVRANLEVLELVLGFPTPNLLTTVLYSKFLCPFPRVLNVDLSVNKGTYRCDEKPRPEHKEITLDFPEGSIVMT